MRVIIVFFLLFVTKHVTLAQSPAEIYDYVLENLNNDQKKVLDTIVYVITQHEDFSTSSPALQSNFYGVHGRGLMMMGLLDSAYNVTQRYINLLLAIPYDADLENYYNILGGKHYYTSAYDSAAHYWIKSAEYAEKNNNLKAAAGVYNNLSNIYSQKGLYDKTLLYLHKAWEIAESIGDTRYVSSFIVNIGLTYMRLGNVDSMLHYGTVGLQSAKETKNLQAETNALIVLGGHALATGDKQQVIEYNKKVVELAKITKNQMELAAAASNIATHSDDQNEIKKYLKIAESYYTSNPRSSGDLDDLARAYEKIGDFGQAFKYQKQAYRLNDSLAKEENSKKYLDLLTEYDVVNKEKEILEQDVKIEAAKSRNRNLMYTIGGLALLAVGASIFYYQRQKLQRLKQQAKEEEYERRLARVETLALKSQMNPHFIFNSLNSIRYLFMKDQRDRGLTYITKFAKLLRSTLHHGEESLVNLIEEVELTELYIELEKLRFDDQFTFEKSYPANPHWHDVRVPPFIIQPLVENAFWHGLSQSDETDKILSLVIEERDGQINIFVKDNGVGIGNAAAYKDDAVNKKKSYGISVIKERFDLMNKSEGQKYFIEIAPYDAGQGTVAKITVIKKP